MNKLSCFKAYDVRGRLGEELDEAVAYRIGRSFAQYLRAKKVAVGADVRLSSEPLKAALSKGLMDAGASVIDLGLTGTEEVYFAAFHLDVDGAIEVTASHNPINYNGMKFVGRGAKPISGDSGLHEIQKIAEQSSFETATIKGSWQQMSVLEAYVDHLLGYINLAVVRPLTIVVNAGNGAAGHVLDALEKRFDAQGLAIDFVKVNHEPDGRFPNGIPNPLLQENRPATAEAIKKHNADFGLAWDGDFDRCFFFDENGRFIEGYYIVGLLAEVFLKKKTGEKIIHDPRLAWNTINIVSALNGTAVQSKTGHAFIKEKMREENAIYGGEMSAHHYFRDFAYCDSGMIPWLLVVELLCISDKKLSQLVDERIAEYPCSGEINFKVSDVFSTISKVKSELSLRADLANIENVDGLSMEFEKWRFNLRGSNTEPLLRLNVETKGDVELLDEVTSHIKTVIEGGN